MTSEAFDQIRNFWELPDKDPLFLSLINEIRSQACQEISERESQGRARLVADRTDRELWVEVGVVMYLPAIDFVSRSEGKPSVGEPFSVMVMLLPRLIDPLVV